MVAKRRRRNGRTIIRSPTRKARIRRAKVVRRKVRKLTTIKAPTIRKKVRRTIRRAKRPKALRPFKKRNLEL